MNVLRGICSGIGAYGRAFSLLFSGRFWWFLLFPAALCPLLFFGIYYLIDRWGVDLSGLLGDRVEAWTREIPWLSWAGDFSRLVTRWLLRWVYAFSFLLWGGYLLLAVMSPVFSWLSERVEASLSGVTYPFRARRYLWEVGRGVLLAAGSMVAQSLVFLVLLVFSFFPLVGLLAPVLAFLASAYFYGFAFMDYAVERKRLTVREGVGYIHREAGRTLGVGLVFALALLVLPGWRWLACGLVSLLAVMAAAISLDEASKRGR